MRFNFKTDESNLINGKILVDFVQCKTLWSKNDNICLRWKRFYKFLVLGATLKSQCEQVSDSWPWKQPLMKQSPLSVHLLACSGAFDCVRLSSTADGVCSVVMKLEVFELDIIFIVSVLSILFSGSRMNCSLLLFTYLAKKDGKS